MSDEAAPVGDAPPARPARELVDRSKLPGAFAPRWHVRVGLAIARPRWALALAGDRSRAGQAGTDLIGLLLLLVVVAQLRVVVGALWLGVAIDLGQGLKGVLHVLASSITVDLAFLVIGALILWLATRMRQPLGRAFDLACVAAVPLVLVEHGVQLGFQIADVAIPQLVVTAIWAIGCAWAGGLLALGYGTRAAKAVPLPPARELVAGSRAGLGIIALAAVGLVVQTTWVVRHLDWVKPVDHGTHAPVVELPEITATGTLGPVHPWPSGKVVVLDFWATWCGPCLHGLPVLQQIARTYTPDVEVITVNLDDAAQARRLFDQASYTMVLVADDGAASARYGVQEIPHTVVIDRDGRVRAVLRGASAAALDAAVRAAVQNQK